MKKHGVDFEIVKTDEGYQVWTPDTCGAVIGSGETTAEAKADAIANLITTASTILNSEDEKVAIAES